MTSVAVITNVVPLYRRDFYRRLADKGNIEVTVFCQKYMPGMNLKLAHGDLSVQIVELRFLSLREEKLVWQFLPLRRLWRKFDVYIFYGNPRVISSVLWASLFKLCGMKVALWGQVHSAGAASVLERIRLLWWRMFDGFFVYNDSEVQSLASQGFSTKIIVGMNNGLNQARIDAIKLGWTKERLAAWKEKHCVGNKPILLSCGRLNKAHRYDLALQAISRLSGQRPIWHVIGRGPEEPKLKMLAERLGLKEDVRWLGAVYEEEELAPWFLASTAFLHPGAAGLSVLHAFGYGLPVITHDNAENHYPEFAAVKNNVNALLYHGDEVPSLVSKIEELLSDPARRLSLGTSALRTAREEYNIDVMAARFERLIARLVV